MVMIKSQDSHLYCIVLLTYSENMKNLTQSTTALVILIAVSEGSEPGQSRTQTKHQCIVWYMNPVQSLNCHCHCPHNYGKTLL